MQYILTQEEYEKLQPKYIGNSKAYIITLGNRLDSLEQQHAELQGKYNKLLVFGVTAENQRLKGL